MRIIIGVFVFFVMLAGSLFDLVSAYTYIN